MNPSILFCGLCKKYTLLSVCPSCGAAALNVVPPKYSPDDRFAHLTRQAKEQARKEAGLL